MLHKIISQTALIALFVCIMTTIGYSIENIAISPAGGNYTIPYNQSTISVPINFVATSLSTSALYEFKYLVNGSWTGPIPIPHSLSSYTEVYPIDWTVLGES